MEATEAEVYASVRNRALEEAAIEALRYGQRCISTNNYEAGAEAADDIAAYIRALKSEAA